MVEDPGARRQTLAKRAKNAVMFEDAMERRELQSPFRFRAS